MIGMRAKTVRLTETALPVVVENRLGLAETGGRDLERRCGTLGQMVKELVMKHLEQHAAHQGFQVEGREFSAKRAVKDVAVLEKRLDQNVDSPLFMRREMKWPIEGQGVRRQARKVQFPDGAGRV